MHDLWWSMQFAPDKYQVCGTPMWHSNMNGIFVKHSQMKIWIILRCHKMKTLLAHMMIGVFLWLCCMIDEEYMLGCWMDECVWLKCIPCSVWWPLKMAQMGWKIDFDGLIGVWKVEKNFKRSWIPFDVIRQTHYNYPGGVCLQIDHVWNFQKYTCSFFNSHHLAR